jgi:competence protein ComEC
MKRMLSPFFRRLLVLIAFGFAPRSLLNATPHYPLQVYFVDVEGGQATLFVTPSGHSLLVDTGFAGHEGRDADRIVDAAKAAGVERIDYVLITHYHPDHVGGVSQLAAKIPIGTFIDHGPHRDAGDPPVGGYKEYAAFLKDGHYGHIVARPGDVLPIPELRVDVISGDGDVLTKPLAGAGTKNTFCETSEVKPADETENARSLGMLLTFGKLRILDPGDLTWDKERELMCPLNKLGRVDLYVVSHHGSPESNSPALVDAISARVAIMDNGATKGGSIPVLDTVEKAPGLEDLWQLHYSEEGGAAHNVAERKIANLQGLDTGHYLKVTALENGRFEVYNSRNGATKAYTAR